MEDIISNKRSEKSDEIASHDEAQSETETNYSQEPETSAIPVTSRYVQTNESFFDMVNHRPTKNKQTQTSKLPAIFATNKPKMKSVETQTHYQALVSPSIQTDSLEFYSYELELYSDELNKESSSEGV